MTDRAELAGLVAGQDGQAATATVQPSVPDRVPVLAGPGSATPAVVAAALQQAEVAEQARQVAGGLHGLPGGPAAGDQEVS